MNITINDLSIWKEKVERASKTLSYLQNELKNSIACINNNIYQLEIKINELTKTLEVMNQVNDVNLVLFSPYENSYKKEEENNVKTELKQLSSQLPKLTEELRILLDKQKENTNIEECIEYFKEIIDDKVEEFEKQKTDKNAYQLFSTEHDKIKILETQEIERQRIARDLHDSIIQNLTNIVHKTELCLRLMDLDTIRAKLEMATMIDNIRLIINNMREIIYNLRPMSIQEIGLKQEINNFLKTFMLQNKIQVKFDTTEENYNLLPVVNLTIFRIIQEACNNIAKYAKASACRISLQYMSNQIELIIQDNGIGFDMNENLNEKEFEKSGFGLSIMRERVHLLSGELNIESNRNKGTKIHVIIPYLEQREEQNGANTNYHSG